jgi:general secretion pathway protein D/MSHA biogenesis protein MshL
MDDSSSIGINWSSVLSNFNVGGTVTFGDEGQVYPFVYNNDSVNGSVTYTDDTLGSYFKTINPGQFISNIVMDSVDFDIFLNALEEQGDTKILSNPKLSVMNGQPAMITVGRNVTYVDSIESDVDSDTNVTTYTVETERVLSGIGMALTATVLNNDEIIMNLVPITSVLEEPIEYLDIGEDGASVGLPVISVREMNTTVKVKNGEMLVIGGLISDTESSTSQFMPILGDIPVLRYLFGYEEKEHIKRELIILLRPRLI